MSGIWRARATVLTLVGALVVHHSRFLFATEVHEHALAGVHAYLSWLVPLAGVLALLCAVELLARFGREAPGPVQLPRMRVLWTTVAVVLLNVFAGQESVETLLAHGHLPTLGELLAGGGWTAIPFAILAALAIALLLRGAAAVVRWIAHRRRAVRRQPPATARPAVVDLRARGSVLARWLAGRAPPSVA